MRAPKKYWAKPEIGRVELGRARQLLVEAIDLIGNDHPASAELRSILKAIDNLPNR